MNIPESINNSASLLKPSIKSSINNEYQEKLALFYTCLKKKKKTKCCEKHLKKGKYCKSCPNR